MPQNTMYLLVGALLVVSAGLGYFLYQEKHKEKGVEVSIGSGGLSVQPK